MFRHIVLYICLWIVSPLASQIHTLSSSHNLDLGGFATSVDAGKSDPNWPRCEVPQNILIRVDLDSSVSVSWDTTLNENVDYEILIGDVKESEEEYQRLFTKQKSFVFEVSSPYRGKHTIFKIRKICIEDNLSIPSQWKEIDFDFNSNEPNSKRNADCIAPIAYNDVPDCILPVVCGISDRLVLTRQAGAVEVTLGSPITQEEKDELMALNVYKLNLSFKRDITGFGSSTSRDLIEFDLINQFIISENPAVSISWDILTERLDSMSFSASITALTDNNDPNVDDLLIAGCNQQINYNYTDPWPYANQDTLFDTSCNNGLDDDNDGLIDAADDDCDNTIDIAITTLSMGNCNNTGRINARAFDSERGLNNVNWNLSSSDTLITSSSSFFSSSNLPNGYYTLTVEDLTTGNTDVMDSILILKSAGCPEICDNGIDDDLDGLTDCEDPDCSSPEITSFSGTSPTCPDLDDGIIDIIASGNNLKYSFDGGTTFTTSSTMTGFLAGEYTLVVIDSINNCAGDTVGLTLFNPTCDEICDNGIDDDGDGLIDCDDETCEGVSIVNIISENPSCNNGNAGMINIQAVGNNTSVSYSVNGGASFGSESQFSVTDTGIYTIVVRSLNGICTDTAMVHIVQGQCNEICGNGIDDDGDGEIDETIDCILDFIYVHYSPTCPNFNDGVIQFGVLENIEYSIDAGSSYSSNNIFNDLTPGTYQLMVHDTILGKFSDFITLELLPGLCEEICDNGVDDNGNGLVDCEDGGCGPTIDGFIKYPYSYCPSTTSPAAFEIVTECTTCIFRLGLIGGDDNFRPYQSSKVFENLNLDGLLVYIKDTTTLCEKNYPLYLDFLNCCIDTESVCSFSLDEPSCKDKADGRIVVNSEWPYSVLIKFRSPGPGLDTIIYYQEGNTFNNIGNGLYLGKTGIVEDQVFIEKSFFYIYVETLNECLEICNNGIDDDGDGNIDCEDNECGSVEIFAVNPVSPSCPGNNDGAIGIQANGANLQYSIDGGNSFTSNSFFQNLSPGTYDIVVRNSISLCYDVSTENIYFSEPDACTEQCGAPQLVNIEVDYLSCPDSSDGRLTVNATGENLEYTLDALEPRTWQSSNVFENLSWGTAGELRIRNSESLCSYYGGNFFMFSPEFCDESCGAPAVSDINTTTPSCPDSNDGSISVTATGSSLEYSLDSISWSTNASFNNLSVGSYDVYIRNNYQNTEVKCVVKEVVSISPPIDPCTTTCGAPNITSIDTSNPVCSNSTDGSISVFATGANLEYSIDGQTYQTGNSFNALGSGAYTVNVRNSVTSCEVTSSPVNLTASDDCNEICSNTPTIDSISIVDAYCPNSNGSLEIFTTLSNAEYSIDNGVTWQSSSSFEELEERSYDIKIRDADLGCESESTSATVSCLDVCSDRELEYFTIDASCGEQNGRIFLSNDPDLEYSLDNGASFIPYFSVSEQVLLPGSYTVSARDKNSNCVFGEIIEINNTDLDCPPCSSLPMIVVEEVKKPDCGQDNGLLKFSVSGDVFALMSVTINIEGENNSFSQNALDYLSNPVLLPPDIYTISIDDQIINCETTFAEIDLTSENCVEICGNNIDDDLDGLIDENDSDCNNTINVDITVVDKECSGATDGSISISASTVEGQCSDCEYSFDGGQTFNSVNTLAAPLSGTYNIVVRSTSIGNVISGGLVNFYPECVEICDNGIDDDGDGNIDCEDGDCGAPYIDKIEITELTCPYNDNGVLTILGGGANLEYSIDGGQTFTVSSQFSDLTAGTYEILVVNTVSQCSTSIETRVLYDEECVEICGNGIDDDGDGNIDFNDDDCSFGFITGTTGVDATSASCPDPDDGSITINAVGDDLEYSIDGVYYQSSNEFIGLKPGTYTVSIRNESSGFLAVGGTVTVGSEGCVEICDNGIDDDGDGLTDCEDEDCDSSAIPVEGVCDIIDHIVADSMASNQVLFTLQNIDQASFESTLAGTNVTSATIKIEYESNYGPSLLILPLVEGDAPQVTNWSADIYDYKYDTPINVSIRQSIAGSCPVDCDNIRIFSFSEFIDSSIIIVNEDPEVELPEFECGDEFTPEDISNFSTRILREDRVYDYYGFPILIDSITDEPSSRTYNGYATLPLPFSKKTIKVEFSELQRNPDNQIISGTITALSDPLNGLDLTPDTFNLGGEICLPPPPAPGTDMNGIDTLTGLDPWGFDENGIHSSTGTEFDEDGFNADGTHKETGTEFNPSGCSREERDINGNPCYSGTASSEFVQEYLDSVKNELNVKLTDILNEFIISSTADSTAKALQCDNTRGLIDNLISTLGYDRVYILGENDKYYTKGMNKSFLSKPEPLALNIERNEDTKQLENEHIALYECDVEAELIDLLLNYLYDLRDIKLLELNTLIQGRIANLNDQQVQGFLDDPSSFESWLEEQLEGIVDGQQDPAEITYIPTKKVNVFAPPSMNLKESGIYTQTASLEDLIFEDIEDVLREEIKFGLEQNFTYVNGVHRAYYLEKIVEERSKLALQTGNTDSENLMPICIERITGGYKYGIYLDNISFSSTGAALDAFLIIQDNNSGKKLIFQATNLAFGPTGLTETARLSLESQVEIRLTNAAKLILSPSQNYAEMDCNGFVGAQVGGEVEMCRNYVVPIDEVTGDTVLDPDVLYKFSFQTYVTEWLDFTIKADAPPFAIAGYTDVKFAIDSMVLDMSEKVTPDISIPEGYASPFFDSLNNKLAPAWKGFAIDTMSVTIPNQFSNNEGDEVTVSVEDLVIDGCGISTDIKVYDLIPYEEGNMNGWPMSVDGFGVKVLHNHLAAGEIFGKINVPVLKNPMDYEGLIYPGNRYEFAVSPSENDTFTMLYAEAVLFDNSKISMSYADDEFLAVADLSGRLKFGTPESDRFKLDLPEAEFMNLKVSNQDPYFNPGTWKIIGGDTVSAGINGFGIDVYGINMFQGENNEVGLGFGANLNLGSSSVAVTAGGSFALMGEQIIDSNNRQRWTYKRVDVEKFFLDLVVQGSFSLKGGVEFYENDPIYGEGFQGMIDFQLLTMDIGVTAAAQFGKVENSQGELYRYFYVDALANIPTIMAGPVNIEGFGGGVSYAMDTDFNGAAVDFSGAPVQGSQGPDLPDIGDSFSGVRYTPNDNVGLGIKATALISTGSKSLFNGSVTLALLFNAANDDGSGGGIKKISLAGNGQFLDPPLLEVITAFSDDATSPPSGRSSAITAFMDLNYNFNERTFSGDLDVFLNAGDYLRGSLPGGKMVNAQLFFSREEWFINIGVPDPGGRCGIMVDVPGVLEANLRAYLNVGSKIPDFPGLPPEVLGIVGEIQADESLRSGGGGFMFGADFNREVDIEFPGGSIYGRSSVGFDLMLRDYGETFCNNTQEQIGLGGWYASGQAWAYIAGSLKLGSADLASVGLAAVLQAQLPNPIWFRGDIAGQVSLLGTSQEFNFTYEVGESCDPYNNSDPTDLVGLEVITYATPSDNAANQSTGIHPEIYFSVPLEKSFEISGIGGEADRYQARLGSLVINSKYGALPYRTESINSDKGIRIFTSDLLPANDSIVIDITIDIYKNGTYFADESKTFTFKTGDALETIPNANIAYTYPVDGMYDFYKEENSGNAFIQLNGGQPNLFYNLEEGEEVVGKLFNSEGDSVNIEIEYLNTLRRINFRLEPSDLLSGETYSFEIVHTKEGREDESIFDRMYFRVSEYNTFADKVMDIQDAPNIPSPAAKFSEVGKDLDNLELFGKIHTEVEDGLVRLSANINNNWFNNRIDPILYDDFPQSINDCDYIGYDRDLKLIEGAAIINSGNTQNVVVTEDNFLGSAYNFSGKQVLKYTAHDRAEKHFKQVNTSISECIAQIIENNSEVGPGQTLEELIEQLLSQEVLDFGKRSFPQLDEGIYKIDMTYILPDGNPRTFRTISIDFNRGNQ